MVFKNPLTTGLCCGIAGGLVMVLIEKLMPNVLMEIAGYAVFLVISVLTVTLSATDHKYRKLFLTALITFMIMFCIVYLYLVLVLNPNGSEITTGSHIIRIAGMFGIGILSSILLTFLVTRRL
jgi:hypothetical protein